MSAAYYANGVWRPSCARYSSRRRFFRPISPNWAMKSAQSMPMIQDVYIRHVERVNGELYNVEFDKYEALKDPFKASQTK
jgi:hypothetical protein